MTPTVPTSPADRTYADELRAIADDLDALGPDYPAMSSVTVYIQPPDSGAADQIKSHVDDVAVALLGKPGETREMSSGVYHHTITGFRGSVQVSVFQRLPKPDAKDAEIERLRAEVAVERAAKEFAQSHLGTEGAVSQPKPDTLLTEYTGRGEIGIVEGDTAADQYANAAARYDADEVVTGRASVPDMQTRAQCSPECRDYQAYQS